MATKTNIPDKSTTPPNHQANHTEFNTLKNNFDAAVDEINETLKEKGEITSTGQSQPASPLNGDFFTSTITGTLTNFNQLTVIPGNIVRYNSTAAAWQIFNPKLNDLYSKNSIKDNINEAIAIMLLHAHNAALSFQGFTSNSSTPYPNVANRAWIAIADGEIHGVSGVTKGQIIRDTGSTYVAEDFGI